MITLCGAWWSARNRPLLNLGTMADFLQELLSRAVYLLRCVALPG